MTTAENPTRSARTTTIKTRRQLATIERRRPVAAVAATAIALLGYAAAASAQLATPTTTTTTTTTNAITSTAPTVPVAPTARIIEWNLPAPADAEPGAMAVDTRGQDRNRVWFVTRLGTPKAYRFETPKSLMKGTARWTSWDLNAFITGGVQPAQKSKKMKPSWDRRFVFIRTVNFIPTDDTNPLIGVLSAAVERVDTQNCRSDNTCELVEWDEPTAVGTLNVSDVSLDDRNNVYTTFSPENDPTRSYVQRLTPGSTSTSDATVTRWVVGGGAGLCGSGQGSDLVSSKAPCVSGIDVSPYNRNLVYYSEPVTNYVAELNVSTNTIRRWSLDKLGTGVQGPRQLNVDRSGKVWVITASGHLVSLEPNENRLSSHQMPDKSAADPFGVAPDDDVVGYTASAQDKVGMLIPKGPSVCITPETQKCVTATPVCITPNVIWTPRAANSVPGLGKTVAAQVTKQPDGTYIEAVISVLAGKTTGDNDSHQPLGITPVQAKSQGTFFYTVGLNNSPGQDAYGNPVTPTSNRIGFVRLPVLEKIKHPRDDDDKDDGCDDSCDNDRDQNGDHKWHTWHDHGDDHDRDDDGVDDKYDDPSGHEHVDRHDSSRVQGGQTASYPMIASPTTLALIAVAEAADPLAQVGVDIFDSHGVLVATSAPTPGLAMTQLLLPGAGQYNCVVHNYSLTAVDIAPTLIVREPVDPDDAAVSVLP